MSSNADDSHSPPADVPPSSDEVLDSKKDEKVEESVDHDNKIVQEGTDNSPATQTSTAMPKIDLLACGNDKAVKGGGATDAPAGGNSNEMVQISPDQSSVDENSYEIIYNFPPDISILNINGQMRFEFVTVRENGRLQIFMIPYRWPQAQLVRSPLRNGRLRIWLLDDDQYGGDQVSPPQDRQDDRTVD